MGARDRARRVGAVLQHLVGELVRRADGRGVGRFLREEVCGPAGLDFAAGLSPAQQAGPGVRPGQRLGARLSVSDDGYGMGGLGGTTRAPAPKAGIRSGS